MSEQQQRSAQGEDDALEEEYGEFIDPNDIQDQIVLEEEMEGEVETEEEYFEGSAMEEEDVPKDFIAEFSDHTDSIYKVSVFERASSSDILLATASGDDSAFVLKYNTERNEFLQKKQLLGHKDTVVDVGFNFDGTKLATGSMDGTVGIWNVSDGNNIVNETFLEGPGEAVEWIQWHPKGNLLACGSADTTAWLWNIKTGKCLNVFAGHSGSVTVGGFTSDGKLLVTGSEDASVRIWNPVTAECVHVFHPHEIMFATGPITAFKSQEQEPNLILTASEDGTAQLSHIAQKKTLGVLRGHKESIESVDMSAFNSIITLPPLAATASMDTKINLWDLNTLSVRQSMQHKEGVTKVLFDTSQPLIYSCSVDKSIIIWDVRSREAIQVLRGHRDIVLDINKTSNSSHLFSVSDDQRLLVFKLK